MDLPAVLLLTAIAYITGWTVGRIRGYSRGLDEGWSMAKRLHACEDDEH